MLNQVPQPPFSEIYREIRSRCSWSHFNYKLFQMKYLPAWRKGTL